MLQTATSRDAPIGIFDSGIGGLSVLRHIRDILPHENLLYFADSGFAPYGEKPEALVIERTLQIAEFLIGHGCKALVVACNTATAAAIHLLRERYPDMPIVGVEPGLKPAAMSSRSGKVGVLATDRTIASAKYQALRNQITSATSVTFIPQACAGLADRIEKGEVDSDAIRTLVQQYVAPFAAHNVDTLVLGCTHYPFVRSLIESAARQAGLTLISIIDTGEPVARQLARLLEQRGLARAGDREGVITAFTTGEPRSLSDAFDKLLGVHPQAEGITV